ncbi:MAG: asparagine synthase (glutamine-hydrolyzing) [Bacteroidetes bacterium]|nr:asparagine synthase (glutamine-hydrolyzing) [Bacteroidota bacterium]
MCGIAGIINKKGQSVTHESVKKMTDTLIHRGPDGEGIFTEKNIGLGHRRLSILDISDSGSQPMFHGNDLVIVFNGEIYNYIEIRESLRHLGYSFSTESDTEVLLAAYAHWGEACVHQFNGMWAFAIYDRTQNKIFCSRDRFGIKPFYFFINEDQFIFASEIKAILKLIDTKKANITRLMSFLAYNMSDNTDETFFADIRQLRGGHSLTFDLLQNKMEIHQYYVLKQHQEFSTVSLPDAIELFEKEFARSIDWRLRSDVKVGTCLSGGLDSSYIAAIASKQYTKESGEKFTAITAGSVDAASDETQYARIVAEHCNLDWHLTTPDIHSFEKALLPVIQHHEEPFGSPSIFMQHFVMKLAHESGVKVLLDGQGSDEILLGYPRYIATQFGGLNWYELPAFITKCKTQYGISVSEVIKNHFYFSNATIRSRRIRHRLQGVKEKFLTAVDFGTVKQMARAASKDLFALQHMEILQTQIPQLLKWEDKNSMAHSIETRLPFLDYKVVELALSLNNNFKIVDGWSKYLLRKNMEKVLPNEITWRRKKIGFNSPINFWLPQRNQILHIINNSALLRHLYKDVISQTNDRNFEWRLYNIALWEQCYDIQL